MLTLTCTYRKWAPKLGTGLNMSWIPYKVCGGGGACLAPSIQLTPQTVEQDVKSELRKGNSPDTWHILSIQGGKGIAITISPYLKPYPFSRVHLPSNIVLQGVQTYTCTYILYHDYTHTYIYDHFACYSFWYTVAPAARAQARSFPDLYYRSRYQYRPPSLHRNQKRRWRQRQRLNRTSTEKFEKFRQQIHHLHTYLPTCT